MTAPTTTPAIELVPLRWWHLDEVAELETEVFGTDSWSAELFWSELAQSELRYYLIAQLGVGEKPVGQDPVGQDPGRIVGYAGLAAWSGESWVQTVAVADSCRGLGVGRRLMDALLSEARRRDARTCSLEVRADNAVAQQLYASLGFRRIGIRRGYYQPSGADALVLQTDLTTSAVAHGKDLA